MKDVATMLYELMELPMKYVPTVLYELMVLPACQGKCANDIVWAHAP